MGFTGREGKYVKIEDTVQGCQAILNGDCDELPEQSLRRHRTRRQICED